MSRNGRVLRHDQGDDIVSEGQAYALLISELAGADQTTRTIWSWTANHLQRSDGLLSWHANSNGTVLDKESAADADTLAAYALLRYTGPDDEKLHAAGHRIADAVLARESVQVSGVPVVAAGPWATAQPAVIDPSYWMPAVDHELAAMTGNVAWSAAATKAVQLVDEVTNHGQLLPPDWAKLQNGHLVATAAPSGSPGKQYGLDAQRIPLWFATSCLPNARDLVASWWHNVLSHDNRSSAIALTTSGDVVNNSQNALSMLAGAAAATAANDSSAATALRKQAKQHASKLPSYYGDAWLVLGQALLDGSLTHC